MKEIQILAQAYQKSVDDLDYIDQGMAADPEKFREYIIKLLNTYHYYLIKLIEKEGTK